MGKNGSAVVSGVVVVGWVACPGCASIGGVLGRGGRLINSNDRLAEVQGPMRSSKLGRE